MIIKDLVYGKKFGDLEIDSNHIIILGKRKNELCITGNEVIHNSLPSGKYYGYVYIIICLFNDPTLGNNNPYYKKYIGKCSRGYKLDKYYGSGKYIKDAISKYGKDNFVKIVFEYPITKYDSSELERYYIWLLNAQQRKDWYNLLPGGDTWSGKFVKYYEENDKKIYLQKISNSSKNIWLNDDYRNKMHNIHKKVQNFPKNKEHQRQIQKYIQNLPEIKEKNRQSQLRRYSNPEERFKATLIQIENWKKDPNRAKLHSKRISEIQLGWKYVLFENHKYYYKIDSKHIIWKLKYDNEIIQIISFYIIKKHSLKLNIKNGCLENK